MNDDTDRQKTDHPTTKRNKTSFLSTIRHRLGKRHSSDRHSCLAAPYAPSDPETARYFDLAISKLEAPIHYGDAGPIKGKAIYAHTDSILRSNTHLWTESPYLGMQLESNKEQISCCQYCFLPLIHDYVTQWKQLIAECSTSTASIEDLEKVFSSLSIDKRQCGFLDGSIISCACGEVYCSKLCQVRAYKEYHALLCPGTQLYSMHIFLQHCQTTNGIFKLAAMVIARVLCRFLITGDVQIARKPMDMFYKMPWWDVVKLETKEKELDTASLKQLLISTHELLIDALECNLVHLDRKDELHGHSVQDIWTICASILSFEFFTAQIGLFEMNNIAVEIDHPFNALLQVLEPTQEKEKDSFQRVRNILSMHQSKFSSVQGTALFPIICTMNHSCDPNCTVLYTRNGHAHVVAVRDIQPNEELTICYIDIDQNVWEREKQLKEYQFRCFCSLCIKQRQELKNQQNKEHK